MACKNGASLRAPVTASLRVNGVAARPKVSQILALDLGMDRLDVRQQHVVAHATLARLARLLAGFALPP